MSRPNKARIPGIEAMEVRVVLSTATVPAVVQDVRLVQQAFATFRATYNNDYRTVLYGASADGSINPTTSRATFDADVASALTTLNASIDSAVANLPQAATLDATIASELLGSGGNTLQGQLAAIPTPSGVFSLSSRLFAAESSSAIRLTSAEINQQVRTSTPPTTTTTGGGTSATGALTASQLGKDLNAARSAFSTFRVAYNNDVKTILYAQAADGSINPTAARPAFDAQVAQDLATLSAGVTSAISTIPNNASLTTQVQGLIVGTGSDTLESALKALSTPTGVQTTSSRMLNINSSLAIGSVEAMVAADVLRTAGPEVSGR